MITPPPGVQVYLACGHTDMRKGMATLAMLVQQTLGHDPFSGAVYAFRGRRGGLIKLLWHDGFWDVSVHQAAGTRAVSLADVGCRDCIAQRRTTLDVAGRLRMAGCRAQSAAGAGWLTGAITTESLAATRRYRSRCRCADRFRSSA
jgi:hypothetical protein